ncbi:MAG: hypothetical protein HYV63_20295 [Candidatus Schekmanbacteria bacterium]|nr:hypothetical protein [Candidatus Schekmanbacteria bacterium]
MSSEWCGGARGRLRRRAAGSGACVFLRARTLLAALVLGAGVTAMPAAAAQPAASVEGSSARIAIVTSGAVSAAGAIPATPEAYARDPVYWDWSAAFSATDAEVTALAVDRMGEIGRGAPDLVIIDSVVPPTVSHALLGRYVRGGGILILSCFDGCGLPAELTGYALVRRTAGGAVRSRRFAQAYPRVTAPGTLLGPLMRNDGLWLPAGIGTSTLTRPLARRGARIVAEAYQPDAAGSPPRAVPLPTIYEHRVGRGLVVGLPWSLGNACAYGVASRPVSRESAAAPITDGRAAAAARQLMAALVRGALYEVRGLQVASRWSVPVRDGAPGRLAVMVSGDVHDEDRNFQALAAADLAALLQALTARGSFYFVGLVAAANPELVARLRAAGHEVSPHSAKGQLYAADMICGAGLVRADLALADQLLGIAEPPSEVGSRSLRTESWGADETRCGAVSSLASAGFEVVLDAPLESPAEAMQTQQSGLRTRVQWTRLEVAARTRRDDLRLTGVTAQALAFIPAPAADPGDAADISNVDYFRYVVERSAQFADLGAHGGQLAVWLWHPGTLAGRRAWTDAQAALAALAKLPGALFLSGAEVAALARAGRTSRARLLRDARGTITGCDFDDAARAAGLGLWVLGALSDAAAAPCRVTRITDPGGRIVSAVWSRPGTR